MNDLDYLRQMRSLNRPVAPPRDLWQGIEARLDAQPVAAVRRRSMHPWLMAAAVAAVAVFGGSLGLRLAAPGAPEAMVSTQPHWKPSDPRLTGAAVELDAAHMELTQAMQDSPRSAALQRLLQRTEQQRQRLRQFDNQAG
jgi:hypothetical protein